MLTAKDSSMSFAQVRTASCSGSQLARDRSRTPSWVSWHFEGSAVATGHRTCDRRTQTGRRRRLKHVEDDRSLWEHAGTGAEL